MRHPFLIAALLLLALCVNVLMLRLHAGRPLV